MEAQTSDEDLDYLKWELNETKTLQPGTMKLLRGIVQMPFKDRKNPERYDHGGGGADSDSGPGETEMSQMGSTRNKNKIRPSMLASRRVGMSATELEKMKGLSREDQQRKMNALAHEFSFFGVKNEKLNKKK